MSGSTDLPSTAGSLAMCAVGLLLTLVQVNGFGFDFANDTFGFLLVCVGALRLHRGRGSPWRLLTGWAAGLAAIISLVAYGGPLAKLLSVAHTWWDLAFHLDTVATAGVVVGLLLLIHTQRVFAGRFRLDAAPPVMAALYAACVPVEMVLYARPSAYVGALGYLRQAVEVVLGVIAVLTVVACFVEAGVRAENRA